MLESRQTHSINNTVSNNNRKMEEQKSASNVQLLEQKTKPPTIAENQGEEGLCAICMGSYENMCHPNECLHKYCFGCLEEWTKIKQECPYCLKEITSIIHNIQIDGTSEKYSLPSIFKQFSWQPEIPLDILYLLQDYQYYLILSYIILHLSVILVDQCFLGNNNDRSIFTNFKIIVFRDYIFLPLHLYLCNHFRTLAKILLQIFFLTLSNVLIFYFIVGTPAPDIYEIILLFMIELNIIEFFWVLRNKRLVTALEEGLFQKIEELQNIIIKLMFFL